MYTDNALLFPRHVIPTLHNLGSPAWQALVKEVVGFDERHEKTLAFMLMMIRISGCMACETDSYRAMRGCTACAHQTLRRHKGSDDDLIDRYKESLAEVRSFAEEHLTLDIQQE